MARVDWMADTDVHLFFVSQQPSLQDGEILRMKSSWHDTGPSSTSSIGDNFGYSRLT